MNPKLSCAVVEIADGMYEVIDTKVPDLPGYTNLLQEV